MVFAYIVSYLNMRKVNEELLREQCQNGWNTVKECLAEVQVLIMEGWSRCDAIYCSKL